jgi:hypothetical protein
MDKGRIRWYERPRGNWKQDTIGKKRKFGWKAPLVGGLMLASVAVLSSNIYFSGQHSHSSSKGSESAVLVSNKSILEDRLMGARGKYSNPCPCARESEEQSVNQIGSDPFNCIAYYVRRAFRGIDHLTGHYISRCAEGVSCVCELVKEGLEWIKERSNEILSIVVTIAMGILIGISKANGGSRNGGPMDPADRHADQCERKQALRETFGRIREEAKERNAERI